MPSYEEGNKALSLEDKLYASDAGLSTSDIPGQHSDVRVSTVNGRGSWKP